MAIENKKNPPPDKSINKGSGQEPDTSPSTGQHQPDIQDERSKMKHSSKLQGRDPEDLPGNGNPEKYNDGEPVKERSPRV